MCLLQCTTATGTNTWRHGTHVAKATGIFSSSNTRTWKGYVLATGQTEEKKLGASSLHTKEWIDERVNRCRTVIISIVIPAMIIIIIIMMTTTSFLFLFFLNLFFPLFNFFFFFFTCPKLGKSHSHAKFRLLFPIKTAATDPMNEPLNEHFIIMYKDYTHKHTENVMQQGWWWRQWCCTLNRVPVRLV